MRKIPSFDESFSRKSEAWDIVARFGVVEPECMEIAFEIACELIIDAREPESDESPWGHEVFENESNYQKSQKRRRSISHWLVDKAIPLRKFRELKAKSQGLRDLVENIEAGFRLRTLDLLIDSAEDGNVGAQVAMAQMMAKEDSMATIANTGRASESKTSSTDKLSYGKSKILYIGSNQSGDSPGNTDSRSNTNTH